MLRQNGLFVLNRDAFDLIYPPDHVETIHSLVNVVAPPQTADTLAECPELLSEVDVIFSGWGSPRMDRAFLDRAPRLKAVFYGSGAIGSWVTPEVWDRGIVVTTAIHANSIPVSEYALSMILFGLKQGFQLARQTRQAQTFVPRDGAPGSYGSTVGLISLGTIARILIERCKPFDFRILTYDPFVSDAEAARLGVERVSLDELFARSDVVSLHTPDLRETQGMITGRHLAMMKPNTTFINTARGRVVREKEMLDVLKRRPDLQAVLDVTDVEPPVKGSPFYTLPNVLLTPHIAGSAGPECSRMGQYMIDELRRYLRGEPLRWEVRREMALHGTHRPVVTHLPGKETSPATI